MFTMMYGRSLIIQKFGALTEQLSRVVFTESGTKQNTICFGVPEI